MTAEELFIYQEKIYPSQYQSNDKIVWLNKLEREIADYLRNFGEVEHEDFTPETLDEELLVDEPDMYTVYLSARIDFANGEYNRYNNKVAQFNQFMDDFKGEYIRNNVPLGAKSIKI